MPRQQDVTEYKRQSALGFLAVERLEVVVKTAFLKICCIVLPSCHVIVILPSFNTFVGDKEGLWLHE